MIAMIKLKNMKIVQTYISIMREEVGKHHFVNQVIKPWRLRWNVGYNNLRSVVIKEEQRSRKICTWSWCFSANTNIQSSQRFESCPQTFGHSLAALTKSPVLSSWLGDRYKLGHTNLCRPNVQYIVDQSQQHLKQLPPQPRDPLPQYAQPHPTLPHTAVAPPAKQHDPFDLLVLPGRDP